MPSPQRGHRSRRPHPCSQHEMRVAHRQHRRKYGASSPARHCGQNCSQVAALRPATWRSGNSSRAPAPTLSAISRSAPARQHSAGGGRRVCHRAAYDRAAPTTCPRHTHQYITEVARREAVRQRRPVQPATSNGKCQCWGAQRTRPETPSCRDGHFPNWFRTLTSNTDNTV